MKKILQGFQQFILRGNVVELAVGIVIGASFGALVNALVKDIITPLIGAIAKVPDFSHRVVTVNGSEFLYGDFMNAAISFFLTAAAIYFFVVLPLNTFINRIKRGEKTPDPTTKKCPECLSDVPLKARRCPMCTSVIAA